MVHAASAHRPPDGMGCPRAGLQLLGSVSHSGQESYLLNHALGLSLLPCLSHLNKSELILQYGNRKGKPVHDVSKVTEEKDGTLLQICWT